MRSIQVIAVALVALAPLAACSSSADHSSKHGTTVSLKSLEFHPAMLTVAAGTTVTWVDDEAITHTVTSGTVTGVDPKTGLRSGQRPDGKFDAHLSTTGKRFSYTFNTPGTYSYYCSIHQGMNGEVVVTK